MKYSVTGSQMKSIDRDAIDRVKLPSVVLMERAALAVADAAEKAADKKKARILAACGTGNNGADGIAAARILFLKGYDATVLLVGDLSHTTPEHSLQLEIAEEVGMPVEAFEDFLPGEYDVVIDAVFGIGLTRDVSGRHLDLLVLLESLNACHVVAVDIPSGIHADTGALMGTGLHADVTVTFGWTKTGLLRYPGKAYAGTVQVADIGFPQESLTRCGWDAMLLSDGDLQDIPKRNPDSNKGSYGKVLVIAGSRGMSGAAYLSGLAAYRMGAGLVKILTVEENRVILQSQLPEAIVEGYNSGAVLTDEVAFSDWLDEQCKWATTIILGPGIGQDAYVEKLVELVLTNAYVPVVLDADALNTIAANPYLTGYYTENILITPHMLEMCRLTGKTMEELKLDAVSAAREYSHHHGITCVLKDAVTVITGKDGETYLNGSGNSALAKGGSGDVLSGTIGGLLALGMEPTAAAAYGAYIHGKAGELASVKRGLHGVLSHELTDYLGIWPEKQGAEDEGQTL